MATLKQQKTRAKKSKAAQKRSTKMSKKRAPVAEAGKGYQGGDDDEPTGTAPVQSVRRETVQDEVTRFLNKCDGHRDMIAKVKKSKYFANINQKAFSRTAKEANKIQYGLLRMRIGNLLRGAISKAEKAKAKKKKK